MHCIINCWFKKTIVSSSRFFPLERLTSIFASSFPTSSKYSLNFLSFYLSNIFTIYFSSNLSLLKSCFSIISNFFCFLTFVLSLSLNSATTFFVFSKFFSLFYILFSTVNIFQYIKYFITLYIFILFKIFSTSYFSTPFTFPGFSFSTFYLFTSFLYFTT